MSDHGNRRRLLKLREFTEGQHLCCESHRGQYYCPLCVRPFPESAVFGDKPILNEEHCIPDGLGANGTVLACEECNVTAGQEIDHHLHRKSNFEAKLRGEGEPLKGRMQIEGHSLGVKLRKTETGIDIRVIGQITDPQKSRAAQDAMTDSALAGSPSGPMKIRLGPDEVPDLRKADSSILKSAYLLLFRAIGFCSLTIRGMEFVRERIRDHQSTAVPTEAVIHRRDLTLLPDDPCFVVTPGLESFMVPVKLSKRNTGYFVILPINETTYPRWQNHFSTIGQGMPFDLDLASIRAIEP